MIRRAITGGLVLATMIGMTVPATAQISIVELPLLPDGIRSSTADIENRVVVGTVTTTGEVSRAVQWNTDGTVTELETLPGETTDNAAGGINKSGVIVGRSGTKAVVWPHFTSSSALPSPIGYQRAWAEDITDNGKIIGHAMDEISWRLHAHRWDHATAHPVLLPPLPGHTSTMVFDINSSGVAVGGSIEFYSRTDEIPVRWTPDGEVEQLPLLPGAEFADVRAINDDGTIVGNMGWLEGRWYHYYAVRWNTDGTTTKLDSLPGAARPHSLATGINEQGLIVGESDGASGRRAVIWRPDGSITDLGTLPGQRSSEGTAIDELATVAGQSGSKPVRWG